MLKTTLLKTVFMFFSNHEKFFFWTATSTNHKDTLKESFVPTGNKKIIYTCVKFPPEIEKKNIHSHNETQVTLPFSTAAERTLKTTSDVYHVSGVK